MLLNTKCSSFSLILQRLLQVRTRHTCGKSDPVQSSVRWVQTRLEMRPAHSRLDRSLSWVN
eukprot:2410986-Prymnesium_polylepis.1